MKYVIAGARGYLGAAILRQLAREGAKTLPLSTKGEGDYRLLDLTRPQDFDSRQISSGDVILLAAAISSPDLCRNNPTLTRSVNVEGTSMFIASCHKAGARVIFFSSDTVYGERSEDFEESAPCRPAGEYAAMKHEVERRFLGNPYFKVIRLSYVFSKSDKFTRYLQGCAETGTEAELFHPFCRSVVHLRDVVDATIGLGRNWDRHLHPIVNIGGPDVLDRPDIAQALKSTALPALRYRLSEPDPSFFENRPRTIRMKSPHLNAILGRTSRSLREAASIEFSNPETFHHD